MATDQMDAVQKVFAFYEKTRREADKVTLGILYAAVVKTHPDVGALVAELRELSSKTELTRITPHLDEETTQLQELFRSKAQAMVDETLTTFLNLFGAVARTRK